MAKPDIELSFTNRSAVVANIFAADKVMQEAIRNQMKKSGEQERDLAKEFAPIGETGVLRDSIVVEFSPDFLVYEVTSDPSLFPDRYYAPYVEFGTYLSPAQPFLRPAHDVMVPIVREDISKQIRASLDRNERRVERQSA